MLKQVKMCRFVKLFFFGIWLILLCIQCVICDQFEDDVNDCLNQKFTTEFELPLEIVNDKGALELWIHYNGKYDLYQTYNTGHVYHTDLELSDKISPRTAADRANCSNYLEEVPIWYGCPFTVTEDDIQVNITLESFLKNIVYSIDKSTKEVVKDATDIYSNGFKITILNHDEKENFVIFLGTTQSQIDCIHEVLNYSIPLPIEVIRKENHLEVAVGKYDFYNTIALGTICGIQYQLDEVPNPTVEDYAHCSKCGISAELYAWCPFQIKEDENVVTITLGAFFYNNIYTINKSSNEVHYEKSLVGKDPHEEFERGINECKNGLSATNFSLPVKIIRNSDFLEIWVKHNDKYDLFETDVSGSICKHDLQSSRGPDVLISRPPAECFRPGLDVPYYFICPYYVVEDDEYVYFKVHAGDMYLYAFEKSSGELVYRKFPTIYDSGHQGTVSYLRYIVMDENNF